MSKTAKLVCPCKNEKCPNHGDCSACVARHISHDSFTACGGALLAKLSEREDFQDIIAKYKNH